MCKFIGAAWIFSGSALFPLKSWRPFLVVTFKTQAKTILNEPPNHSDPPKIVKIITVNAQNTLEHFQEASAPLTHACMRAPTSRGASPEEMAEIAGLDVDGPNRWGWTLVDFRIPGPKVLHRAAKDRRQSNVTSKTVDLTQDTWNSIAKYSKKSTCSRLQFAPTDAMADFKEAPASASAKRQMVHAGRFFPLPALTTPMNASPAEKILVTPIDYFTASIYVPGTQ